MSELVPNLAELIAVLPINSDGVAVARAFEVDTVEAARTALRAVVADWEQHGVSPNASDETSITTSAR